MYADRPGVSIDTQYFDWSAIWDIRQSGGADGSSLSSSSSSPAADGPAWPVSIGHALLKSVTLTIGGKSCSDVRASLTPLMDAIAKKDIGKALALAGTETVATVNARNMYGATALYMVCQLAALTRPRVPVGQQQEVIETDNYEALVRALLGAGADPGIGPYEAADQLEDPRQWYRCVKEHPIGHPLWVIARPSTADLFDVLADEHHGGGGVLMEGTTSGDAWANLTFVGGDMHGHNEVLAPTGVTLAMRCAETNFLHGLSRCAENPTLKADMATAEDSNGRTALIYALEGRESSDEVLDLLVGATRDFVTTGERQASDAQVVSLARSLVTCLMRICTLNEEPEDCAFFFARWTSVLFGRDGDVGFASTHDDPDGLEEQPHGEGPQCPEVLRAAVLAQVRVEEPTFPFKVYFEASGYNRHNWTAETLMVTPLHAAVRYGALQVVDWLVGHGASPFAVDSKGLPCITWSLVDWDCQDFGESDINWEQEEYVAQIVRQRTAKDIFTRMGGSEAARTVLGEGVYVGGCDVDGDPEWVCLSQALAATELE